MNEKARQKYALIAPFYDLLDYPSEYFVYRHLRPKILENVSGDVLEAGVGTGRNIPYYDSSVNLLGFDSSAHMLAKAKKRLSQANCHVQLIELNATDLSCLPDNSFDWIISTFLCCVIADNLQSKVLSEFARVLKPGGKFKLLEIVYSRVPALKFKQQVISKYVEKIFGARFDRNTLATIAEINTLQIIQRNYLKDDTYLLIEGIKV